MREFYIFFPSLNVLRLRLTWTHYCHLLMVDNNGASQWYVNEATALFVLALALLQLLLLQILESCQTALDFSIFITELSVVLIRFHTYSVRGRLKS